MKFSEFFYGRIPLNGNWGVKQREVKRSSVVV